MVVESGAAVGPRRAFDELLEYYQRGLRTVRHHAEGVIADPRSIEDVHQLRVSSRRLHAVLETLRELLPAGSIEPWSEILHLVRKAAGATREWDVLHAELGELRKDSADKPKRRRLLEKLQSRARRRRRAAVAKLVEFLSARPIDQLPEPERLGSMRFLADREMTVDKLAGRILDARVTALFEQYRQVRLDDVDTVHATRIAGKQLRYALELFREHFESTWVEPRLASLRHLQDVLGSINDDRGFARYFRRCASKSDSNKRRRRLRKLARRYRRQLRDDLARLPRVWNEQVAGVFESPSRPDREGQQVEQVE